MLAAVVTAKNFADAVSDIKKAKDADVIEIRLDYMLEIGPARLKELITACKNTSKKPVIATCRKKSEGGFWELGEAERIAILKKAVDFGADYVDIEYSSDKNAIRQLINDKKNARVIVSYHNFKKTPKNIKNVYSNIKKMNPDLTKIVANANTVADNFRIFELIKAANKEKRRLVAFCMGSYGQFSRVLSTMLGSYMAYASIGEGKESASGQFAINDLIDFYRIKNLNKNTKIAGLIGNPVEHSWSHIIHNAAFDETGLNAVYLKFKVDKLKEFIGYFKNMDELGVLGFSITIPHKIKVMEFLDSIDKKAGAIGAVNTIAVKNKKFIGSNTDCDGAIRALKQKTALKGKNAVVLGAGGSARALAYGLLEEKASVTVLNRTIENAKLIANDFNCSYGSLNDLESINYDVLINATPVGMHPDIGNTPVPKNLIKKGSIVLDIVFNPYETKLLNEAKDMGCTVIHGLEMLVNVAALQFRLWTGKDAPEQLMRKKVLSYLFGV